MVYSFLIYCYYEPNPFVLSGMEPFSRIIGRNCLYHRPFHIQLLPWPDNRHIRDLQVRELALAVSHSDYDRLRLDYLLQVSDRAMVEMLMGDEKYVRFLSGSGFICKAERVDIDCLVVIEPEPGMAEPFDVHAFDLSSHNAYKPLFYYKCCLAFLYYGQNPQSCIFKRNI